MAKGQGVTPRLQPRQWPSSDRFAESCANRFTPLLCVGSSPLVDPPPRDDEECITEVLTLPVPDLVALLRSGADVLGPAFTTAWLALEALRERGEPV